MFKNKYSLIFNYNKSAENSDATQLEQTNQNTGDTSTDSTEGNSDKLFTQEEVNKVVSKRVKEVQKKFSDYDTIKSQVEELQIKLEHLNKQNKRLSEQYETEVYTSNLRESARELNLDYELALKHIEKDKVIFVEGKPTNLKELLQAQIEKFPQLVKKTVVTPDTVVVQTEQKKFSLHNKQNVTFFNGSGLRLNTTTKESN